VGEGTGAACDLDLFDSHYLHLFVWNASRREIVGAYRLAHTDEVVARFGPQGLYSSTLFRFHPGFLPAIQPALELGRSFVRPEYQKSWSPLLLLWKGIGHYVARHPRYRVLFGPVSISNSYTAISRALMVAYLKTHHRNAELAAAVESRTDYSRSLPWPKRMVRSLPPNVEQLSDAVSDVEPDGKGVPVLLRQYLNLGGQILDFNVDRSFSDVLDGLVVVDLVKTDAKLLDRYLGKTGAARFRQHHGLGPSPERELISA
jgi:putative hemolysin